MPELGPMASTYLEQKPGIVRKHMEYLVSTAVFCHNVQPPVQVQLMQKRIAL